MRATKAVNRDTKWVFIQKGTCSRTLFYILNREFENPMELEERAADPFAGGIIQNGYQCGLLWGAVMAVGTESYRRTKNNSQAIGLAIHSTQHILKAFEKKAGSADCEDILQADLSKNSIPKLLVTGKFLKCFKLADKWAPEAIQAAKTGLSADINQFNKNTKSCASEVVKKLGGTEKEMSVVAGFAGGVGLSGNACGALAAAIWMNTLKWCRKNDSKNGFPNPAATENIKYIFRNY